MLIGQDHDAVYEGPLCVAVGAGLRAEYSEGEVGCGSRGGSHQSSAGQGYVA